LDSRTKLLLLCFAAVALSALALFYADGLYPIWWLMWVAPLPVLWIAPRISSMAAFAATAVALILGGLNTWSYHRALQFPLFLSLLALALPAVIFGLAVVLFRFFLKRSRPWLAALSLPSVWVAYEFLLSLSQGTYTNLAYTQMNCLPVLQLASVTGMWGISFILLLFSSALAVILTRDASGNYQKRPLAIAISSLVASVFLFGFWRLNAAPSNSRSIPVALIASDLPQNRLPEKPVDALRLLREYASQAGPLSQRGARIVVFPEMSAVVPDAFLPEIDALFGSAAQRAGAQLVVPIIHPTSRGTYNEARLYSADGGLKATYCKHHLVPVFEDRTRPCSSLTVLHQPMGVLGIEICKDMDYLKLARSYGEKGVGLLLVPAWDFDRDRWLHGRMAIMRGVENGFNIARVAKLGLFTVSDTRGRVTAEQRSDAAPFSSLVAPANLDHVQTIYTQWGDWFAWFNCVLLLLLLAGAVRLHSRSHRVEE
jgi:apolipoprotein N-acyltransferase